MKRFDIYCKQIFDLVISVIALIILSPLLVTISVLITMDDHGPIFFTQNRLGRKGKHFRIIKFRTMVKNAEFIGDGIRVSGSSDSRITRVGRLLRLTSADELPQLFNIIKGEMSLVGPRPPIISIPYYEYSGYPEWAKTRFEMKPGLTGLAQVMVRNSASWEERLILDVRYVNEFSFRKDIGILLLTARRVIFGKGIYPGNMV